jgi:hypothetical protein
MARPFQKMDRAETLNFASKRLPINELAVQGRTELALN